jgi:hypothetical protein
MNCQYCGKEIHFDSNVKSKSGKYIPLSGKVGTAKHRCPKRPFNKATRRAWWDQQRQKRTVIHNTRIHLFHYSTLRLTPQCTVDEIKNAYRRLALEFHPDRNKEAGSADKFMKVRSAYEYCMKLNGAQP